jgi:glycerol-3-phosphate dehydrogenase (NAD(P)+)
LTNKKPILVLGAGSWGTALALVLAKNGYPVLLWDAYRDHLQRLIEERRNTRYLPDYPFPSLLQPSADLDGVLQQVADIVVAVPCEGIRAVMQQVAEHSTKKFRLCIASKGLEPESRNLNHVVVGQYLRDAQIAVISGPSFAGEVAAGLPTAVTVAAQEVSVANHFLQRFHNEVFRIYTNDDIVGVQIGGAVKNVMAIAAGIADGLGFGANTRAALITRGLAEITRLGTAMGGRLETFMGLTGLGDLVLTCTDDQSRNRRLGLSLAGGKDLKVIQEEIGQAIEGARTATAVHLLARDHGIEMPISEQIYLVLNGEQTPREAVQVLLAREPKAEVN